MSWHIFHHLPRHEPLLHQLGFVCVSIAHPRAGGMLASCLPSGRPLRGRGARGAALPGLEARSARVGSRRLLRRRRGWVVVALLGWVVVVALSSLFALRPLAMPHRTWRPALVCGAIGSAPVALAACPRSLPLFFACLGGPLCERPRAFLACTGVQPVCFSARSARLLARPQGCAPTLAARRQCPIKDRDRHPRAGG